MVVSDGSNDGTDQVLTRLALRDGRVTFIRQEPHAGKTAALNRLPERARSEIIVFAEGNSIDRPDAVRRLVAPFADPDVGYASGRILYRPDQLPDFVVPLGVVEQGCRVVYAPEAVLEEETLTSESAEYPMCVRAALCALWALWNKRLLLNPLRFPLFSWQLASHKLLRYLSFLPLAAAAVINWLLVPRGWIYGVLAPGQCCTALLALLALRGPTRLREFFLARYCYYFLLLTWDSAVALVRFLRGGKQVLWQPRTG